MSKSYYTDHDTDPTDAAISKPQSSWHQTFQSWQKRTGFEEGGIERVLPQDRHSNTLVQFRNVLGLWFAGCGSITTMSSFFLPTLVFSLNTRQSLLAGIIGATVGCIVPAYCATMGPMSGCRQMVTARFLFGAWGVRVIALICIVSGVGWSVVNCVLGGEVLSAVGRVPLYAGILIVFVGSVVVGVFGLAWVMRFEAAVAVPANLAILLFYVVTCKHGSLLPNVDSHLAAMSMSAPTQAGLILSFFTVAYSVTATWGSCASDYYVLFPEKTPKWQVFTVTFLGIAIPSIFAAVVGILAGAIALVYEPWNHAYASHGVGGIIAAAFEPWGRFGRFVVVVMYISLVSNTVINTYSGALQVQLVDCRLAAVPRGVWAAAISAVYLVVSLVGRSHLSTILGNVLPMLGYWISLYFILLLEENLFFRNNSDQVYDSDIDYNSDQNTDDLDGKKIPEIPKTILTRASYKWSSWNRPQDLPAGWAAAASFLVGVAGAVLGMNQVYFMGPLARRIGDFGGDIGMWLCMGFCGTIYPFLRAVELYKLGK